MPARCRAARLLGRCHAALGDHQLSASVLDAAIEGAKVGELLFNEAMTVRARALVGATTMGTGPHWDTATAHKRLNEVMGRMDCDRPLLEKLLQHGLQQALKRLRRLLRAGDQRTSCYWKWAPMTWKCPHLCSGHSTARKLYT